MSPTNEPRRGVLGRRLLGRIVGRPLAAFAPITGRTSADNTRRQTETDAHWVFYVGRGDRFDDDRRLIRTAADDAAEAA